MQLLSGKAFRKPVHKKMGGTFFEFIGTAQKRSTAKTRAANRPVHFVERLPLRHSVLTFDVTGGLRLAARRPLDGGASRPH